MSEKSYLRVLNITFGIWKNISRKRKIQVSISIVLMLINALLELISISSILPFLTAITRPDLLWGNKIFKEIAFIFGWNRENVLLPLTAFFCLFILLAGFFKILNLKINLRLAGAIGTDFSFEAYRRIIYQPFDFFIKGNSSEMLSKIIKNTELTTWAINLILQILTSSLICIIIIFGGIIYNWKLTIFLSLSIAIIYILISILFKKRLALNSKIFSQSLKKQYKSLQEGVGSIRNIILENNQKYYLKEYRVIDKKLRVSQLNGIFLGLIPRYIVESIGIILITSIALYISMNQNNGSTITIIGIVAITAQRLLPICQNIFQSWAGLISYSVAISEVLALISKKIPEIYFAKPNVKFSFKESITIDSLYFSYSGDDNYVLEDINFKIYKGEKVGIIGETGSGKSTLIDILMGLLKPTIGNIKVDNFNIYFNQEISNLIEWRKIISHVPQNIFLVDSSIQNNVAFGVEEEEIDEERVKKCLQDAQLGDILINKKRHNSYVGERGIQLSGGQSQRIGLARALYQKSEILFLDEATSALDNETEKKLMKALDAFKDVTIVLIAHRLTTIANCDKVIEIKDGKIKSIGPPSDFL